MAKRSPPMQTPTAEGKLYSMLLDVRLFNVGDYISGMESPMAVSWLLCVAVFWRPAYIILAVIYIYIFICKY
jgi:hypothetical protein